MTKPAIATEIQLTLTMPITVERPAGGNLRADTAIDSLYYQLKDARMAARAIERQQLQGGNSPAKADWRKVSELAQQILIGQSKDLEVTAWLIEAWLREQGFAGLQQGFQLARELIEQYWDDLYPQPDEDGILTKVAALTSLNGEETEGTLITPIAMLPLTEAPGGGPFALWQYQQATRTPTGTLNLELILKAATETSPQFFQNLMIDLQAVISEFSQLIILLDEKCGADAPPTSRILGQLNACLDCVKAIAPSASALLEEKLPVSPLSEGSKPPIPSLSGGRRGV